MLEYDVLSLEEAQAMVQAVVEYVKAGRHRGVAVVVVDKTGRIIASARMDGMAARYIDAAHRKAYTSAVFERDTAGVIDFWTAQEKQGHRGPHDWNDPMATTLPGGYVVCHGHQGGPFGSFDVIGGVGVAGGGESGEFSDDAIAEVAIGSLGPEFRHRRGWE
jgi:glc operon protein GlcG